jgi:hypothetical protein
MTINDVAGMLGYSKEQVGTLIEKGLKLPKSGKNFKLFATGIGKKQDISDDQFNAFVSRFEVEEPGRWPPAGVRRELLVEAGHFCAICRQKAPPQFHHMLDFARVKHHDPAHMLHLCGSCHHCCTIGQIDYQSQLLYKAKLKERASENFPVDAYQQTKRAADKNILEQVFECAPRPLVVRFLELASNEMIAIQCIAPIDAVQKSVGLPSFHLYDKELWNLLKSFLSEISGALEISATTYHDYGRKQKLATPIPSYGGDDDQSYKLREEFQRRIFLAQHAFSLLNCYVREEYPELDLDEIDRLGLKTFAEVQVESERQIKNMIRRSKARAKRTQ